MSASRPWWFILTLAGASACAPLDDTEASGPEDAKGASRVTVKTDTNAEKRQFQANVLFAQRYTSRCTARGTRPKVLVTGFGRFMAVTDNATGRIVSQLVATAPYPITTPPPVGAVDQPATQLSVGTAPVDVPGIGTVDVCGMILPVAWDLAAVLIAKEVDAFKPSFVLMNGVAGPKQPLWIELGSVNQASGLADGSSHLRPDLPTGKTHTALLEGLPDSERLQGNLLSWKKVAATALEAARRHEDERDGGERFGDLLQGVKLATFPRSTSTYVCNNVSFVTGWLMNHPNTPVSLLRASAPVSGVPNSLSVQIASDVASVPRVFVHWPSALADKHHDAGADVMKAIIAGQLQALKDGDAPTVGDNRLADATGPGGTHF